MSPSSTQFDRSLLTNPRPLGGEMEFAIWLGELAYRPGAAVKLHGADPRPLGKQWRGPGLITAGSGGAM
jgi:hypothetical protein